MAPPFFPWNQGESIGFPMAFRKKPKKWKTACKREWRDSKTDKMQKKESPRSYIKVEGNLHLSLMKLWPSTKGLWREADAISHKRGVSQRGPGLRKLMFIVVYCFCKRQKSGKGFIWPKMMWNMSELYPTEKLKLPLSRLPCLAMGEATLPYMLFSSYLLMK